MPNKLVGQLVERCAELWNLYGPTETTIWSSAVRITSECKPVVIGRPIANTTFYILDRYFQAVPMGVPGELFIGGDGLARDYLNRPELTAEKFIRYPTHDGRTERLYRTGDRARWLSNGNVEVLGRIDSQVKVRGFRIELEGIGAALGEHPAILQAAVVCREDIPGDARLVGYFVPRSDQMPTSNELQLFLRDRLPEYAVPSAFVSLSEIPLTPNGKINRQALPEPDFSKTNGERAHVPPRTQTEEVLEGIWREVLRIEAAGVNDNFFELGGHSLIVTQMISRVRRALNFELPLAQVFLAPTIAELAELIDKSLSAQGAPEKATPAPRMIIRRRK